jgi:hypothetical protein|tara:strand:- start:7401 stop:7997 length:597 start_codon:yes stop_codon:yes gene_type:complete
MRTPQEHKRSSVKEILNKTLSSTLTKLTPTAILVHESIEDDFTKVDFSFKEAYGDATRTVILKQISGLGFVDCLFKGCLQEYSEKYNSLSNIMLSDLKINPIFSLAKNTARTDAKTDVSICVEIRDHGIAEFRSRSRSIVYSSFVATLEAFQFYINCQRSFEKLKWIIDDARQRNRNDTVQSCLKDISAITEMNTYAQ